MTPCKDTSRIITVIIIIVVLVGIAISFSKKVYYNSSHPLLDQIRENFRKLNPEYAKIPLRVGDSAYSEDKEIITMCLSDPDTGKYYSMNTLMYVALHELAHCISKSTGHEEEFKNNFIMLLKRAAAIGIYDPQKPIPPSYCKVATGSK